MTPQPIAQVQGIRENPQALKLIKDSYRDFPGSLMVKNLPYNAGDMGLIPGQGTKIPHATGQLSPCATTTEPMHPGACAPQLKKRKKSKIHTPQQEERSPHTTTKSPCTATKRSWMPQQRSPRAATKTQHSQK